MKEKTKDLYLCEKRIINQIDYYLFDEVYHTLLLDKVIIKLNNYGTIKDVFTGEEYTSNIQNMDIGKIGLTCFFPIITNCKYLSIEQLKMILDDFDNYLFKEPTKLIERKFPVKNMYILSFMYQHKKIFSIAYKVGEEFYDIFTNTKYDLNEIKEDYKPYISKVVQFPSTYKYITEEDIINVYSDLNNDIKILKRKNKLF